MQTLQKVKKQVVYKLPQNSTIAGYLQGFWKRNLTCRAFGDQYQILRAENSVVHIDTIQTTVDKVSSQRLKWSFGKGFTESELQFGYIMECVKDKSQDFVTFKWQFSGYIFTVPNTFLFQHNILYKGRQCEGSYNPQTAALVLNFMADNVTIVVTYRLVDDDTMSVAVIEMSNARMPTIEYGTMYRLDPSLYAK